MNDHQTVCKTTYRGKPHRTSPIEILQSCERPGWGDTSNVETNRDSWCSLFVLQKLAHLCTPLYSVHSLSSAPNLRSHLSYFSLSWNFCSKSRILSMGLIIFVAVAIFIYTIYGAIYRLYLSPIAHIPGPKLAALTRLYILHPCPEIRLIVPGTKRTMTCTSGVSTPSK